MQKAPELRATAFRGPAQRTARTSVVISILSLAVTAASFGNQLAIARAFGASQILDQYLQATSFPLLTAGAIGGVFAYAIVPALTASAGVGTDRRRISGAFVLTFAAAALSLAAIGWISSPMLVDLLSSRTVSGDSKSAVAIARFAWLTTACGIGVGFSAALLNVHGRFILPVVVASVPYIGATTAILVMGDRWGGASIALGMLAGTFCAAFVLSVAAAPLIQLRGLSPADFQPVRSFARAAPVAVLSVLTFSVYQSIDAFWAPYIGPSNLSVLGYCQRLLIAIGAVTATGPSVILQPRLAAASAAGDYTLFLDDLGRGIKLTLLVCAPVALWIAALGAPLVRLAFERGAFDRAVTLATAGVLPYMLVGMVPMLCTTMLFKAMYARADLRTAAVLGASGPILYFALSAALVHRGLAGIGAAYALTWTCLAAVGCWRVWGGLRFDSKSVEFLRHLVLLLLTVGSAAAFSQRALRGWSTDRPLDLLCKLALCGACTAAAYFLVALKVARVPDLRALFAAFRSAPRAA